MKNSTKLILLAGGVFSVSLLSARNISEEYETISTIKFTVIYPKKSAKYAKSKDLKGDSISFPANEELIKTDAGATISAAGEVVRAAGDTLVKGGQIVGPIVGAGLLLLAKETAKFGWMTGASLVNAAFARRDAEHDKAKDKTDVVVKVEPLELTATVPGDAEYKHEKVKTEVVVKVEPLELAATEEKMSIEERGKKPAAEKDKQGEAQKAAVKPIDTSVDALKQHIKNIIDGEKNYLTLKQVVEKLKQRGVSILNKDGSQSKDPLRVVSTLRGELGGKYATK